MSAFTTMETPAKTGQTDLATALDRLWVRFLPEIQDRVAVIQSAVDALAAGSISGEQAQAAASAAHKLAGVLGTFNLHRGTEVARELEQIFSTARPDSHTAGELAAMTAELRSAIESRT